MNKMVVSIGTEFLKVNGLLLPVHVFTYCMITLLYAIEHQAKTLLITIYSEVLGGRALRERIRTRLGNGYARRLARNRGERAHCMPHFLPLSRRESRTRKLVGCSGRKRLRGREPANPVPKRARHASRSWILHEIS